MNQGTIEINILEGFSGLVSKEKLLAAVIKTLNRGETLDSPSMTVVISNDEQLKEMNIQYRGIDKTTDVLAFEADFEDPDLGSRYLGDVVISYQQAQGQAITHGHTVEEELQLLVVHGVLHLLGFDHDSDINKKEMWSIQSKILADLGLDLDFEEK